jgi:hypothetical protein
MTGIYEVLTPDRAVWTEPGSGRCAFLRHQAVAQANAIGGTFRRIRKRPAAELVERETQLIRAFVRGLDHPDLYRLADAAALRAVVLDQLDSAYPDPARRADAGRLRDLADLLHRANQARDWIEEEQP